MATTALMYWNFYCVAGFQADRLGWCTPGHLQVYQRYLQRHVQIHSSVSCPVTQMLLWSPYLQTQILQYQNTICHGPPQLSTRYSPSPSVATYWGARRAACVIPRRQRARRACAQRQSFTASIRIEQIGVTEINGRPGRYYTKRCLLLSLIVPSAPPAVVRLTSEP